MSEQKLVKYEVVIPWMGKEMNKKGDIVELPEVVSPALIPNVRRLSEQVEAAIEVASPKGKKAE